MTITGSHCVLIKEQGERIPQFEEKGRLILFNRLLVGKMIEGLKKGVDHIKKISEREAALHV